MKIFADLHMHSRFSRACSNDLTLENIEHWARKKGLGLVGTGDFTHPSWIKEIKKELKEDEKGIYRSKTGFPFVLQTELANIYTQDGKGRKVHNILLAPSIEVVEQITEWLLTRGRVDYDGRPIFGISCVEFAEKLKEISKDIEIIPAHCLPRGSIIMLNPELKTIEEVKAGEKVYTHTGLTQIVKETYSRKYKGFLFNIIPWYFTMGTKTTDEHPFLTIKTVKRCKWKGSVCKPTPLHKKKCTAKHYLNYKPRWIQAKMLEVGDALLFPRFKDTVDKEGIVYRKKSRNATNDYEIKTSKELCRLIGYYLAEGYTNSRDAIGFSFSKKEASYIEDVKNIVKKIFGLEAKKGKGADIIFYSKGLMSFFEELCYANSVKRAQNKALPIWALKLPLPKQVELFKGWWRGDKGSTSSRILCNQMKIIALRLGIIPSIRVDTKGDHAKRGKHKIGNRQIEANYDNWILDNLSFFEDSFGLLNEEEFKIFKAKKEIKHGWIDENYAYLPIRKIEKESYEGEVFNLEVENDNSYLTESATVHNCWTPWFSIFGSMSGFDSVEECFQDKANEIFALETGLSSDPAMNWRISKLDRFTLLSNSDSHSYWPWRMGRECNILDIELSYKNLINAIRTGKGFLGTVEVDPNYGKYHLDGHRACNVCFEPAETKKHKNICPKCGNNLTIGVLNRVEELADRKEGYKPKGKPDFYKLIPLAEIIAGYLGVSQPSSKKVFELYDSLVGKFGNELNIVLEVPAEKLEQAIDKKLVDLIIKNREGKIEVTPGYDGVYGVALIEPGMEAKVRKKKQKSLAEF